MVRNTDQLIIGAHVSIAGGYHEAVKRVHGIGGNALQIFSTPPRGWKPAEVSDEECERFQEACREYGVTPSYFHASYMINLAGKPENQEKSVAALTAELSTASRCGVKGTVVHVGSFVGEDKSKQGEKLTRERYEGVLENIERILAETPDDTLFLIENMGMRKIGRTLEEIGFLTAELASDRVGVCLDSCHLHAAGYDISSTDKLDAFLEEFDTHIGREKLECFHVNDSRDEFGSLRDRHENLGDGEVATGVFETLVNHPEIRTLPLILETPGIDGNGPDAANVERLRGYVHK